MNRDSAVYITKAPDHVNLSLPDSGRFSKPIKEADHIGYLKEGFHFFFTDTHKYKAHKKWFQLLPLALGRLF